MQNIIDLEDAAKSLNTEELCELIAECDATQKEKLCEHLSVANNAFSADNENLKSQIQKMQITNEILLKKVWRVLSKENKKELALFFKNLSEEFAVSDF